MGKKFNFVISADENPALKAMRRVTAELYKVNQAFRNTKKGAGSGVASGPLDPKSLAVVQQELKGVNSIFKTMTGSKNQWERDAGFTQLKNAFKGTASAAGEVKSAVEGILTPILALTGIGSVAGLAKMTSGWADLANQIKQTSFATGMSEESIQKWTGAGTIFGIKSEQMAAGLENFSGKMADAAYTRDPGLNAFLTQKLGIGDLANRVQNNDTEGLMKEVWKKIQGLQGIGAASRSKMIDYAGLGFIKPMMAYGDGAVNQAMDVVGKYGYTRSTDQAVAYYLALGKLNIALETFQKKLSDQLIPEFKPVIDGFSDWIVKGDNINIVFGVMAPIIVGALVPAIALLGKTILMTPLGRLYLLAELGLQLYEHWHQFVDLILQLASAWDRLHFERGAPTMGKDGYMHNAPWKPYFQSYDDYKKTQGFQNGIENLGISSWYKSAGPAHYDNADPVLPASPRGTAGANGKVTVELKGFPYGTTVQTHGNVVAVPHPVVNYSMPPGM